MEQQNITNSGETPTSSSDVALNTACSICPYVTAAKKKCTNIAAPDTGFCNRHRQFIHVGRCSHISTNGIACTLTTRNKYCSSHRKSEFKQYENDGWTISKVVDDGDTKIIILRKLQGVSNDMQDLAMQGSVLQVSASHTVNPQAEIVSEKLVA